MPADLVGAAVAVPRSICRFRMAATSAVAMDTCPGVPMSTTRRCSSPAPGGGCSSSTKTSHFVRAERSRLVAPPGPISLPMVAFSTSRSCRTLPSTISRCAIRSPHFSVVGGQVASCLRKAGSSPPDSGATVGSIVLRTSATA